MLKLLGTFIKNEASIVGETSLLLWLLIAAATADDSCPSIARVDVMVLAEDLRHLFASNRPYRASAALCWIYGVMVLGLLILIQ